jgi:putative heme iron utilization protein
MADNIAQATGFLGSLGINTHGGDYLDGYKNSSLIIQSLKYIGISTVRDAFSQYGQSAPVLEAMADAGIKFDFRVRYDLPASGEAGLDAFIDALKAFQAEHPGAVISIEGINEINLNDFSYNGDSSLAAAANFQKDLYTAIKADPDLADVAVINLSVAYDSAEAYAAVGDLGAYSDYANAHTYTITGTTADKQMENSLELAKDASSGDPVVITETGYTTLESEDGVGASETAQAKLILNNLFNAYENGSQQTYIYELLDTPNAAFRGEKETQFGIFNADGTPKLAATALHNLTTILSYGDDGSANTSVGTAFTMSGTPTNTHSMVLGKSGDVYDIVVWAEKKVWDEATETDVTNAPVNVTIDLGEVESVIRVYDPLVGLEPIAVYTNVSSFKIPLSDHPLIIEVGADEAVQETVETVSANQTMTAEEFIAQIDDLADSSGLASVTLTDTHMLAVSSIETMKYMIANYGDVLSKVVGGYSFAVTYGQSSWQKTQEFDASGSLTQRTEYGLKNGEVVSKCVYHTDGSYETYAYGITGQAYTTDHVTYDANGKVVEIERLHADGTLAYLETRESDGSKHSITYDTLGRKVTEVDLDALGTKTTSTYDPSTGKLKQVVKEADGDVYVDVYLNGLKSSETVSSHEGWKEVITYDTATGKMLTDLTTWSDGSAVNKIYTNGVLMKQYERHADGTLDNYWFNITGKTYVTEHQSLNSSGAVVKIERLHADGTYDYLETRATDGSKHLVYYNTAGKTVTDVVIAADGTNTTSTFDPATAKITKLVVKETDGDILTTAYSTGVKTSLNIVSHDGWKETLTYDTSGKVLTDLTTYSDGSAVNKIYTSGVLMKQYVRNADGTLDNYVYNITGKTYVTEHQSLNASGAITKIERLHADGTYDYLETRATDGGKHVVYYNSAGKVTTDVVIAADGTNTTSTFDPATAKITKLVVKETDGDVLTTAYSSGVKTSLNIASHDGWKETITYDTSGKVLTDLTTYSDGSAVNKIYTGGVLMKQYVRNADGTLDNYVYNITGKTYVTEHQSLTSAGVVKAIDRLHADGTYDYQEIRGTDGSKHLVYYNTAGKTVTDVVIAADGTNTTSTFDPATAKITKLVVKETDGDVLTTLYTSGVKTTLAVVSHDGWTETVTYDTAGKILTDLTNYADGSVVNKIYTSGVLIKQYVQNADGSLDNYFYNITGKTYVTEHQSVSTSGKVTFVERLHSDGTYDYVESNNTDGSRHLVYYNTAGKVTTDVAIASDGTNVTMTYDVATGDVAQRVVKETDGDIFTSTYTSGVRTTYSIVSHEGWNETLTYDKTTGKVLTDLTNYADGGAVNKIYTDGVLMKQYERHADGSLDNYFYNITGKTYVTEHQSTNTAGVVTYIERFHADGTFDYQETRATDGSKVINNYTTAGALLNHSEINADGSRNVDYYLQDGTGNIRHDALNTSSTVVVSDMEYANGTHTVYSYANSQTLDGGSLADTFYFRTTLNGDLVYEGGNDTVYNFDLTSGGGNIFVDDAFASSFSDLQLTQKGSDVLVTFDTNDTILLKATTVSAVTSDHFVFG